MKNFEKIKQMNIDEMAEYIRCECLSSCIYNIVLLINEIKQWLESEVENAR